MRRFKAEWVEAPQVTKTENNLFSSKTIKLPQVNMRLFLNAIEDCYGDFDEAGYDIVNTMVAGNGAIIIGKRRDRS
ncbi:MULTISPECIES: hypothetical protein [Hyphomicrobiales]|uniref:hypothetical protein n=1 Tax=Hyphomicrobiales TaxID=356 RepID=UPI002119FD62|nr:MULTISPECIES: hypothetical protein [Hyphomicrobiales]MCQ9147375.1 hypothetical protein [Ochrobactrum sp. BTU2]MDH1270307.1 hypothetical protein [Agrobacterium pusense]